MESSATTPPQKLISRATLERYYLAAIDGAVDHETLRHAIARGRPGMVYTFRTRHGGTSLRPFRRCQVPYDAIAEYFRRSAG